MSITTGLVSQVNSWSGSASKVLRLDEFELGRRQHETRNEWLISWLLLLVFTLIVVYHLVLRVLPEVPARPTVAMIASEVGVILISIGLLFYLQSGPVYYSWRKYALSAFDVLSFATVAVLASGIGEPVISLLLPIPGFVLTVVLVGLRYSTRAVIYTGLLALLVHAALTLTSPTTWVRIPALVLGAILLTATTLCIAYMVASLKRLHRDSVFKERLRRFLSPEVAAEIARAPEVKLGAVETEVTVLFSDISGFTALSEGLAPQEILDLLNEYFAIMAAIVFRYNGTLEKYIGDALLAVWGAPLRQADDAAKAVTAAIEMQHEMEALNRRWMAQGRPPLAIHVGLHTGRVAAGNIGTEEYLQYATIGDTTNVASRICSSAEAGEIFLSLNTSKQLADLRLDLEPLAPVRVKGKSEPLELYRLNWAGKDKLASSVPVISS